MDSFIQWLLGFVKYAPFPIAAIAVASGFGLFAPPEWLSFLAVGEVIAHNRAALGIAFLLSTSALVVSAIRICWQNVGTPFLIFFVDHWLPDIRDRRNAKKLALKNMAEPTYAAVLRYLKVHGLRRVPVGDSQLLHLMEKDHLLIRDLDCSIQSYYVVPDYVWNLIDKRLENHPVPASPPWLPPPEWVGRIAPLRG
jgi:hypothetical protein